MTMQTAVIDTAILCYSRRLLQTSSTQSVLKHRKRESCVSDKRNTSERSSLTAQQNRLRCNHQYPRSPTHVKTAAQKSVSANEFLSAAQTAARQITRISVQTAQRRRTLRDDAASACRAFCAINIASCSKSHITTSVCAINTRPKRIRKLLDRQHKLLFSNRSPIHRQLRGFRLLKHRQ